MDERLVNLYNAELRHLREIASEFAREYPVIAGRLALGDPREICPDPYVERLLEGFAWLAARVHLKLDAEFPRFTQALLETVYPHFLSPVPSMGIVRFEIDPAQNFAPAGVAIPRGTPLKGNLGKGDKTACVFQTAHEVKLLPLRVSAAQYFTATTLGLLNLPPEVPAQAAIRIRLQTVGGQLFEGLQFSEIAFYVHDEGDLASVVYGEIFAHNSGVVIQSPGEQGRQLASLPPSHIRALGFAADEALLPPSPRGFEGYRLLREYFALPRRFLFFKITGLAEAIKQCKHPQLDLVIPLKDQDKSLEKRVSAGTFELFCTPVINLFPKKLDSILLSDGFYEFHVVPDKSRTIDFEIFEIRSVTGRGSNPGQEQDIRPFYLAKDTDTSAKAYYTTNRVPRMLTQAEREKARSSDAQTQEAKTYAGTELFLSLVDANSAPYRPDLRSLDVEALCTNRHLPGKMAVGPDFKTDLSMALNAPIKAIRVTKLTQPKPSHIQGRFFWRLISHLSLNYLTLVDSAKGDEGAAGLRELLSLYVADNDSASLRQIEGLLSVKSRPIIRRVVAPGPISFARGLEITLGFDKAAFEGIGVFILGAVLDQFFAKYVSINSFTETVIRTQDGELIRWPTRMGIRQIL